MDRKYVIHKGDRFGRLTCIDDKPEAIRYSTGKGYTKYYLTFRCDCGNIIKATRTNVGNGTTKSCGCLQRDHYKEIRAEGEKSRTSKVSVGQRFGRLVVLKENPIPPSEFKGRYNWLCKCDCGNTVVVRHDTLARGEKRSCGCLNIDSARNLLQTHGHSYERIYSIYQGMVNRCYYTNYKRFYDYGGRGIYICDEWYTPGVVGNPGFMNFYNWSYENGYYDQPKDTPKKERLTIDRIDNNGPYAPWNCRWVTAKIQAKNRRCAIKLNIDGKTESVMDIAARYGVDRSFIVRKLDARWTVDQIAWALKNQDKRLRKPNSRHGFHELKLDPDIILNWDGFKVLVPKQGGEFYKFLEQREKSNKDKSD